MTSQRISFRVPLLRSFHWLAKSGCRKMGYEWEVRHIGELSLGLLRKKLSAADRPKAPVHPKRLVFIPGLGDTPLSWLAVFGMLTPVLKAEYDEVVLFDFPAFGGFLSQEKCFPSMDAMIQGVTDVLDSLRPHTLIGHSLGGWLSATYASRKGVSSGDYQGPEKLLLIDPAGLFANQDVITEWEGRFKQIIEGGFEYLRPHTFAKEPFWFKYFVPEYARFITREDVLAFMRSFNVGHNLLETAHQIKGEVWLLWGDQDTLCHPSWAQEWMRALGKSQGEGTHLMRGKTVLIRNSGHSPQIEATLTTSAVIGQILSGRTPHRLGKFWYKVLEDYIDTRFHLKAIK